MFNPVVVRLESDRGEVYDAWEKQVLKSGSDRFFDLWGMQWYIWRCGSQFHGSVRMYYAEMKQVISSTASEKREKEGK